MKVSDFNRVLSLYTNSNVDAKTCVQIIIQLSMNQPPSNRLYLCIS